MNLKTNPNNREIKAFQDRMTPFDRLRELDEDPSIRGITIPEFLNYLIDENGKVKPKASKELNVIYAWMLAQTVLFTEQEPGPVQIYTFPVPKEQLKNMAIRGEQIDEISKAVVFEEGNNRIITDLTGINIDLKTEMLSFIHPIIRKIINPKTGFVEWIFEKGEYDPITKPKIPKDGAYKIDLKTGLPDEGAVSNLKLFIWLKNSSEFAGFPIGGSSLYVGGLRFDGNLVKPRKAFYTSTVGE